MARILAVEWDSCEAPLVLGRTARNDLVIEQAVTVELPSTDESHAQTPELIGETLRASIAEHGLASPNVLLGIRRADVELKQLTLPPAPDSDLPALVGHQAAREFSSHADGSRLDFVPLDGDAADSRRVIAAALSGEQVERTQSIAESAGISPQRWLLRAYATVSLVRRHAPDAAAGCLLVEQFENEAALTALVDGQAVFLRAVRISGQPPEVDALVSEIRRTLLAVKGQFPDARIETICVLGGTAEHAELIERLASDLSIDVRRLDPFDGVKEAAQLRSEKPQHVGRFAALIGMLIDEATDTPHKIDFLHPRRPPAPKNRRRMVATVASIAAALFLFVVYSGWSQIHEVNKQIKDKREESAGLDKLVKRAQEKRLVAETIGDWTDGEIVWLDELRDLSLRFPSQRDAVVLRLGMAALPATRRTDDVQGAIDMDVLVRDSSLIDRMATNLTDQAHKVDTGQVKRVKGSGDERANPWQFDATISVGRSDADQYANRLTTARNVDATPGAEESANTVQANYEVETSTNQTVPDENTGSRDTSPPPNSAGADDQ